MTTKIEQEAVKLALADIASENNGLLTPDAVVAAAKDKDSVLHDYFQWDGKKAAHAWRIEQARTLIRSVRVVITTHKTSVSVVCYIRDPGLADDEQGYVATASLVGDKERSGEALIAEFSRAAGALRRARELAIAFEMEGEVEAVSATVQNLQTRVMASVEQRQDA